MSAFVTSVSRNVREQERQARGNVNDVLLTGYAAFLAPENTKFTYVCFL
jgi:hypothetical protein